MKGGFGTNLKVLDEAGTAAKGASRLVDMWSPCLINISKKCFTLSLWEVMCRFLRGKVN